MPKQGATPFRLRNIVRALAQAAALLLTAGQASMAVTRQDWGQVLLPLCPDSFIFRDNHHAWLDFRAA
jgi:hypothetical protein